MPFSVTTYPDEDQLAAALLADVSTFNDEDQLDAGIAAATQIDAIVVKGLGKYTLIDTIKVINVSVRVIAKGAKYTVILETA